MTIMMKERATMTIMMKERATMTIMMKGITEAMEDIMNTIRNSSQIQSYGPREAHTKSSSCSTLMTTRRTYFITVMYTNTCPAASSSSTIQEHPSTPTICLPLITHTTRQAHTIRRVEHMASTHSSSRIPNAPRNLFVTNAISRDR